MNTKAIELLEQVIEILKSGQGASAVDGGAHEDAPLSDTKWMEYLIRLAEARELKKELKENKPDITPSTTFHVDYYNDAMAYINRYPDIEEWLRNFSDNAKVGRARDHYERFGKDEGRIWGRVEKIPAVKANTYTDLSSDAPAGFLWKPVSESRGGIPALLTPKGWEKKEVSLRTHDGGFIKSKVEYRGLTNGDRQTYFFHGVKANQLPSNTLLNIGSDLYLIKNPTVRVG